MTGLRPRCGTCARAGFTLIELLVVIAIIAVLIGLLLPAVQMVRESGSRTQCLNNLKQIGVALHNYHGTYRVLPPGYLSSYDGGGNDTGPGWGWAAHLLPYVEQRGLFNSIHFDQPIEAPANAGPRVASLQVFLCPSDNTPLTWDAVRRDDNGNPVATICSVASANYAGVFGISEPGVDGEGIFFRNSKITFKDISDGTSTTLMVGERSFRYGPATWVGAVSGAEISPNPGSPAPPGVWNSSGAVLGHTAEGEGGPGSPGTEVNAFSSAHPGGALFLFADGHVAFLLSSMDHRVYKALSTRAGGEPVGEEF
jgi:prepilin-type N-terminal cleavage/methylation domain-containing protein/prepilin-type processing-associated H-X9-DG protein